MQFVVWWSARGSVEAEVVGSIPPELPGPALRRVAASRPGAGAGISRDGAAGVAINSLSDATPRSPPPAAVRENPP